MNKKYIMVSLDDERSKAMAGVLGNKTCKKVIELLAEKEASEKDIADSLKLPMNTIEYNLKKLLNTGLIEKARNFFWSKKGKKIVLYKLSNKSIVISPKSSNITSKIKSLAFVVGLSGIAALLIRQIYNIPQEADTVKFAAESSQILSSNTAPLSVWIWFLIGALFVAVIFTLINWRKI